MLTIEQYQQIADTLRELKAQIDPLFDLAWSNGALKLGMELSDIQGNIQGLIYMSSPQTEWLGGDSSDSKNFTKRLPHIAKQDKELAQVGS